MFGLDEEARCQLWLEAREDKLSSAKVREISAVLSLIQEVMGKVDSCSGRERTMKKGLANESNLEVKKRKRESGTWQDVEALVLEDEKVDSMKEWRTAALAVVCYFGCRRFGDINRVRVEDVTTERDKITVYMRKNKTDELNEGQL